jgi:hypothetical protein
MIAVNERVDVPELQLDCRMDVVEANDTPKIADDFQAALKLAPVIVRQF